MGCCCSSRAARDDNDKSAHLLRSQNLDPPRRSPKKKRGARPESERQHRHTGSNASAKHASDDYLPPASAKAAPTRPHSTTSRLPRKPTAAPGGGSAAAKRALDAPHDHHDDDDDGPTTPTGAAGAGESSDEPEDAVRPSSVGVLMMGWALKRGHTVRSWKRRFFVLDQTTLYYYEKEIAAPPYGEKLKGKLHMLGATVEIQMLEDKNPVRHRVHCIGRTGEKDLLMEVEGRRAMGDWQGALSTAVRTCNVESLLQGERLPEVVVWYNQQHSLYRRGLQLLQQGQLLRQRDPSGRGASVATWVTVSSDVQSLTWQAASVGEGGSAQAPRSVLFRSILRVSISDDPAQSLVFTIFSNTETLVLEAPNEETRDQWVGALMAVVNVVTMPTPEEKPSASLRRGSRRGR